MDASLEQEMFRQLATACKEAGPTCEACREALQAATEALSSLRGYRHEYTDVREAVVALAAYALRTKRLKARSLEAARVIGEGGEP